MLEQDLHLSHFSLPNPIAGLCCNEVNTDNSYTAKAGVSLSHIVNVKYVHTYVTCIAVVFV